MRVTQSMIYDASAGTLSGQMAGIRAVTEKIGSSKQLNRPSDNPADVRTSVGLNDTLAQLNQFVRNIGNAQNTLSAMDTALSSAGELIQRANELAIQGANATLSPGDRQAIAAEVIQLTEAMAQDANAKVGDSYIFSGFKTNTAPFQITGPGQVGAYQGDGGVTVARIAAGSTVQISMNGASVFQPAIDALTQLAADLNTGQAVQASTMTQIANALQNISEAQSTVGARENRLSDSRTTQQSLITSTQAILSQLEDTNMPAAITELTQRQTTYQASLAVTAKVMQTSLIDYLR
jgi:flagellar hook-associated protein 3 FlgL